MNNCLFCAEYAAGYNTFFENNLFRARWDGMPIALGHAEVLPKRHVQYFHDLTVDEKTGLLLFVDEVITAIQQANLVNEYSKLLEGANTLSRSFIEKAYQKAANIAAPDAFNHGLNDGAVAGQTIPHFHYHIIPRRKGDIANPRGGIRRIFGKDEYSDDK